MGTSICLAISISPHKMRAFLSVLLAVATVSADSDAYTYGQVTHGYAPGVITGVDYGNGVVTGYGAVGNRFSGHHIGGYSTYGHAYPSVYAGHHFGKREAEAEADADAYTIGQVAHGLPVHNAYATGHPYNVGAVTYTSYPSTYASHAVVAPAVHSVAAVPAVHSVAAVPAVPSVASYGIPAVHSVATPAVYSTYNRHYVGKREAEADAYTIG